jgi:hypothetical protein
MTAHIDQPAGLSRDSRDAAPPARSCMSTDVAAPNRTQWHGNSVPVPTGASGAAVAVLDAAAAAQSPAPPSSISYVVTVHNNVVHNVHPCSDQNGLIGCGENHTKKPEPIDNLKALFKLQACSLPVHPSANLKCWEASLVLLPLAWAIIEGPA